MKPRIRKILTNKIKRYLTSAIGSQEALELMVGIEPIIISVTDKDGYEWITAKEISLRTVEEYEKGAMFMSGKYAVDDSLDRYKNWLEREEGGK